MASYNQSVLEQHLSREAEAPVGWPWKLLLFSIIVLVTVFAVYLGMRFGFKDIYLKAANASLDRELKQLELNEEQKRNLIEVYSQVANIDSVIKSRNLAAQFLSFLEANTLNQVSLDSMNLSFEKSGPVLKLAGSAQDFEVLSQQMEIFRTAENVSKIILNSSNINKQNKSVVFSLSIYF